jgi:hypothetical protein
MALEFSETLNEINGLYKQAVSYQGRLDAIAQTGGKAHSRKSVKGGDGKEDQNKRFKFIQEMVVSMKKNTSKKTAKHTDFISAAWMIYKKVAEDTKDTSSIEKKSMEMTKNPDKYIIEAMNKPKKEKKTSKKSSKKSGTQSRIAVHNDRTKRVSKKMRGGNFMI